MTGWFRGERGHKWFITEKHSIWPNPVVSEHPCLLLIKWVDGCFISIISHLHFHLSYTQLLITWHRLPPLVTQWSLSPDGRSGCYGFDLGHETTSPAASPPSYSQPWCLALIWTNVSQCLTGLGHIDSENSILGTIEPESPHPRIIVSKIKEMQNQTLQMLRLSAKASKNIKNQCIMKNHRTIDPSWAWAEIWYVGSALPSGSDLHKLLSMSAVG